jgi:hypothetical protein
MLQVGFKSTTPVFERAKIVLTLDRAATVIGSIQQVAIMLIAVKGIPG